MAENVITLTDETFDDVLESDIPYLVDFWAEWCAPCRMIAPIVEELAGEYQGKVKFGKLNTENEQKKAVEYSVNAIPTLIIFKGGKAVKRITGLRKKEDLKKEIDEVL